MKTVVKGVPTASTKTYNRGDHLPAGLYEDRDGDFFLAGHELGDEAYFRFFHEYPTVTVDANYVTWPLTALQPGVSVTFTQE